MSGLSAALIALIRRDMRLVVRHPSDIAHPVMFFVIVVALFPFGVGSDPLLLRTIGPGVIWVGALLATLLSLDALFRSDFDDGTLEQMALSGHPLTVLVLGKVFVHWCATGLPLLVVTPLLAGLLGITGEVQLTLLGALALGTPTLSLVGARSYLRNHKEITTLSDLSAHKIVGYIPDMIFDKELDYISEIGIDRVTLASNSVSVQMAWIRQGHGLGIVHDFATKYFRGRMASVLPEQFSLTRSFYLIRHQDDRRLERMNRFAEALVGGIRNEVSRLQSET